MTPRKQRRKLQMERVRKGLPPARPWTYSKERRLHKISEMIAEADQKLAKDLGISSELVTNIRARLVIAKPENTAS